MPFVRISASASHTDEVLTAFCDAVFAAIVHELERPSHARYLELDTFDPAQMALHSRFIGIANEPGRVFVHVHLNHPCTIPQRRRFAAAVGKNLRTMAGVRERDVLLLIHERGARSWTFGDGTAHHVALTRQRVSAGAR
jgi:hypothetical protein